MSDGNGALPEGWEATTVEGISNVVRGGSPRPAGDPKYFNGDHTPWITVREITKDDKKYLTSTETCLTAEGRERSRFIESGTLLLTNSGATLGVPKITKIGGCINDGSVALLGVDGDSQHYMYHYLRTLTQKLRALKQGAAQPNLNTTIVKEIEVPLPPLAEQRRIVSKIESLQERSSRARRALSEVGPLLEQFRQSVLRAAFSGRLTADWRAAHRDVEPATELLSRIRTERRHRWEQSELAKYEAKGKQPPKNWQDKYKEPDVTYDADVSAVEFAIDDELGWQVTPLELLVDPNRSIPYGIVKTGDPYPNGVPTVRCGDIKRFSISIDQLKKVDPALQDQYRRTQLEGGEVLIAIRGSVGETAVVPDSMRGMNISREVAMIPVLPGVSPKFLMYLLASPGAQRLITGQVKGVAQSGINLADLRLLPTPLPPFDEQVEIENRIEQAINSMDAILMGQAESETALTQLDQSILAKAFRGELVPQDPRDEPASELLDRIREQLEAEATKKKAKRKPKKKRKTQA